MAIKISGTTVFDDSRNLVNLNTGAIVGVQSGGNTVGAGATTLNFIGAGNTFHFNPSTKTLDVSIQGGGGGGISSTGIATAAIFSNFQFIYEDQDLTAADHNYFASGPLSITSTVTVGAGNTFVVV